MAARDYADEVSKLRVILSAIEQVIDVPKLTEEFTKL